MYTRCMLYFLVQKMTCMVAKYSFSDSLIAAAAAAVPAEPKLHCIKSSAAGEEGSNYTSPPPLNLAWVPAASESVGRCNGCSSTMHQAGRLGLPEAWWEGQLAESIHRTLQHREKLLDTVKLASPQLHKRQVYSEWQGETEWSDCKSGHSTVARESLSPKQVDLKMKGNSLHAS